MKFATIAERTLAAWRGHPPLLAREAGQAPSVPFRALPGPRNKISILFHRSLTTCLQPVKESWN
ncbi:hypothetical protein DESUT3_39080 [Desulfuromonas versatilis]|uniref:Uncharacterized protein n=1 Tax=Desulfuromonas versatilis TaxID=2802975 RepID=A0ABN6E3U4_9BACT|nr:hypothetical protein [Desulfuromonas versatilis]BCR06839.1 hypothetical protein DESUT3_39080 [Desulfuromonas versatilis]